MGKRIVIALGGNALGNTLPEQMTAVKRTATAIAALIRDGHQVVLTHGNGPQVGMIQNAMGAYSRASGEPVAPLTVCVAMSQGYIGYDLQNALREALLTEGIEKPVATVLTQVRVEAEDPAFKRPTKPIGHFMTRAEAEALMREKGCPVAEDAGRGYRRVVASPRPQEIIEIEAVKALTAAGQVVIAAGGGGIPVIAEGRHLRGVTAVIDKDFASACLASMLDADWLVILTAVEKVMVNYGKPNEAGIDRMTPDEARAHVEDGQFAPGSMLPKVQAAIEFVEGKTGRMALITKLDRAADALAGHTGTRIAEAPDRA